MANVGDRFTVSSDGEVYAERMPSVGFGPYWQVTGPRVLRGGRVDPTVTAGYGVIRDNGTVNVWGGTGTAGRHYRTFIDMAVADLASGRAAGKLRMRGIGQQGGGKKRKTPRSAVARKKARGAKQRRNFNPEACPGCGGLPGDGLTPGCNDPDGCGYYRRQEGGKKRQAPAAGGLRAQADRIRKLSRGL